MVGCGEFRIQYDDIHNEWLHYTRIHEFQWWRWFFFAFSRIDNIVYRFVVTIAARLFTEYQKIFLSPPHVEYPQTINNPIQLAMVIWCLQHGKEKLLHRSVHYSEFHFLLCLRWVETFFFHSNLKPQHFIICIPSFAGLVQSSSQVENSNFQILLL